MQQENKLPLAQDNPPSHSRNELKGSSSSVVALFHFPLCLFQFGDSGDLGQLLFLLASRNDKI